MAQSSVNYAQYMFNSIAMIINYLKIAFRSFQRDKIITLIKVIGLALGLATVFFILLYVSGETSYNHWNKNKDAIYRINQINHIHDWKTVSSPYPFRDAVVSQIPEIDDATRIVQLQRFSFKKNDQFIFEPHVLGVDENFFHMFTIDFISGTTQDFQSNPQSLIITESAAKKYFGTSDAVSNTLEVKTSSDTYQFTITAVIADVPKNSTIKGDFFTNMDMALNEAKNIMVYSDGIERDAIFFRDSWEASFLQTYIQAKPNTQIDSLEAKINRIYAQNIDNENHTHYLQNLGDIYLHSQDIIGGNTLGDLTSIYIFSGIAFIVLLIAVINYVILTVSQTLNRTKEIGIRKIIGAQRSDLLKQIISESAIVLMLTIPIAFILIEQLRPFMEQLLGKKILFIYNQQFIFGALFILFFVLFIPGLNIIHYLNKITPISILRKEGLRKVGKFRLRSVLIVFQFTAFACLVTITLGIRQQINFSTTESLGYKPFNKMVIQVAEKVKQGNYQTLKNEILKHPDVKSVSGAMWLPPSNGRMSVSLTDTALGEEPFKIEALFVDEDFIETMGIKMAEGNSFANIDESPEWKVILNNEAAKLFGESDILGKKIWSGNVIGVSDNFRFHSVHEKVAPTMLIVYNGQIRELVIDFNTELSIAKQTEFKAYLNTIFPEMIEEPKLLSKRFEQLYIRENRLYSLIGIFSFLAILIASIGLLGLTIFTTKKQTKNIAIRKINGATIPSLMMLLLKSYLILIAIAFLLSIPLSYFILSKWLQNFAYKAPLPWWQFGISGVLAFIITLLTISWYSASAAKQNPVESLRYE